MNRFAVLFIAVVSFTQAWTPTRRDVLAASLAGAVLMDEAPANAFANKISTKYDDRPKRRGSKPKDLGVSKRNGLESDYVGLKGCGPAPNCFSTFSDDDEEHAIPAWTWPSTTQDPMNELKIVIESYPPGQSGIDGGGFEIQTVKENYLYVQFESLKNSFIDDVEFALLDNAIQVRSSSRLGYLDFGVNAKRLNWIAQALRKQGWTAEGVDLKTHQLYTAENQL